MPAISSDTLFHFVTKREYLIDILENNFKPRYCQELLSDAMTDRDPWWDRVIPMKCFCDLTLSSLGPHLKTYGEYGIGMTKDWGKQKGITPVLYVHPDSPLIECVRSSVGAKIHSLLDGHPVVAKLAGEFQHLVNFSKPYVGSFLRDGAIVPDVRFYDEREWRYVPANYDVFESNDILDDVLMAEENRKIGDSSPIKFTPDDIRYIVVPSEKDILPMLQDLRNIKSPKYDPLVVAKLQTRIQTADQIRADF